MMKLAAALLLLAYRPAAGQKPPPKCTRVQMIEAETRSQWILPGEPLPKHWAEYFNKTNCDAGPAGLEYNCNVGDVTGIGYYYTAESTQAGYANEVFAAAGIESEAIFLRICAQNFEEMIPFQSIKRRFIRWDSTGRCIPLLRC